MNRDDIEEAVDQAQLDDKDLELRISRLTLKVQDIERQLGDPAKHESIADYAQWRRRASYALTASLAELRAAKSERHERRAKRPILTKACPHCGGEVTFQIGA